MELKDVQALQTGKPYKTYRKTILGKVLVVGFNTFTQRPEDKILSGNPLNEDAMFDVYSEMEDVFFRRNNMRHLREGVIIEHIKAEEVQLGIEQMTDEEIRTLVNSKYLVLQNKLRESSSETFLNRVLDIARQEEKNEKILSHIETRISEVQLVKTSKE